MSDNEILSNVLRRVGENKPLEEVVISQEKEINYLRERIKEIWKTTNLYL